MADPDETPADGRTAPEGTPVEDGDGRVETDQYAGPDERSLAEQARSDLLLAWREHHPYVALSATLFFVGVPAGVALWLADVDLFAVLGQGGVFPDEITAGLVLVNNTRVFLLLVAGVLTFGLLTAFALVFNGLLVGYVAAPVVAQQGPMVALAALLPHGIPELAAFFVAGGVTFRFLRRAGERLAGRREVVLNRGEWRRTGLVLLVAWLALAVAAVVEVHVTFPLVEWLAA